MVQPDSSGWSTVERFPGGSQNFFDRELLLGFSGMMLPGVDGFAQTNFRLNTALILGIGYSWVGVGSYIAATVYALVSAREERGRS